MAAPNYTGTQLYNQMQGLSDPEKFLFYRANMGTGSGGNDLQSQFLNQGFGGDLGKFNNFINTQELNTKGSFDPNSGKFNYFAGGSPTQTSSSLAGWGGSSFGGAPGTHNAATSGFSEAQAQGTGLAPGSASGMFGTGGASQVGTPSLGTLAKSGAWGGDPGMGSFTGKPTDYFDEAGYKFRLGQGADRIENSAAARGSLQSGATIKGLEDYRQGLASEEYGKAFDRFTNARNFDRGVYQDDRNFGRSSYENDRNFDYGANRDDRDFNFARDQYNQQFGYNAARDDRNFNYGTLRDLAQMGLGATSQSGNLANDLARLLGGFTMTGAGAGAQGTMGGANNVNDTISQILRYLQGQQVIGAIGGRP